MRNRMSCLLDMPEQISPLTVVSTSPQGVLLSLDDPQTCRPALGRSEGHGHCPGARRPGITVLLCVCFLHSVIIWKLIHMVSRSNRQVLCPAGWLGGLEHPLYTKRLPARSPVGARTGCNQSLFVFHIHVSKRKSPIKTYPQERVKKNSYFYFRVGF